MPEHPTRDAYVTATSCPVCATPLNGRADQRYCTPACRQTAYRARTQNPNPNHRRPTSRPGSFPPRAHRLRMRSLRTTTPRRAMVSGLPTTRPTHRTRRAMPILRRPGRNHRPHRAAYDLNSPHRIKW